MEPDPEKLTNAALKRAAKAQTQIGAAESKLQSARQDRAVAVGIANRGGKSMRVIAEAIGVSHATVQNILKDPAASIKN